MTQKEKTPKPSGVQEIADNEPRSEEQPTVRSELGEEQERRLSYRNSGQIARRSY